MLAILAKLDSGIYCLKEALLVNAGNDEVALVDGFRTLSGGTDADGREWMTYACEEAAFFGKGAAVAYYCKGVHLKAVVVVKAERLMLDYSLVKLET